VFFHFVSIYFMNHVAWVRYGYSLAD